jgi:protein-disulfide isomerase
MRCEEISEYFADHLTGTLSPAADTLLSQHLIDCARCRTEFEDLTRMWSDLERIPAPQPDSAAMRMRFTAAMTAARLDNHRPKSNFSIGRFNMRQAAKPIGVIAVTIAIATGTALFFSRCGMALACPENRGKISSVTAAPPANPFGPGGHIRGSAAAAVTVVEYGDYECPPCGTYEPIVTKVLQEFAGKVKLEFHHFPLTTIHPNALLAATAAEAAADQGRYWEMHDILFASRSKWSKAADAEMQFIAMASQIGLDSTAFAKSLRSPETQQRVRDDMARGRDLQVEATPTFFLNGQKVQSAPSTFEEFADLIEHALKK